ncbi:DUF1684 domain-containing protein [Fulvivirgaceae bacterium BMA12]|uniref:DUF1684 domain-containing protein n=1 Tax=Agaribacillus aureus TaxID=3051825 RepID=A0ABT8L8X6_9BACT|nr:DUF1684 domain-containing protein [Fulvivirgaceae bacterium BMA12]
MKNTRILSITAGLVVVGSIIYTFSGDNNVIPYAERIQKERADKDTYLLTSKESPLSEEDKRNFQGLSYYPVNELFKVKASLELIPAREIVTMPTSDGKEKRYRKFANARFELKGKMLQLVVYEPLQKLDNLLFLPFADGTSALETYGAGRYLDFEVPDGDELIIDFNLAYNPYCAYSDKYSCPLPPRENFMSIAIEAGEKNYLKN